MSQKNGQAVLEAVPVDADSTGGSTDSELAEVGAEPATAPAAAPPTVLPGESLEEMAQHLAELAKPFVDDSALLQDVEAIIANRLRDAISVDTVNRIGAGLEICLGYENARYLISMLGKDLSAGQAEFLTALARDTSVEFGNWLRRLLGKYNREMLYAYSIWNENPNGWSQANTRASYDCVGERWWVSFDIAKNDGSHLFLEDTPQSMLSLSGAILATLTKIPIENLASMISAGALTKFTDDLQLFEEHWNSAETDAEQGAAAAPEQEQVEDDSHAGVTAGAAS